jgi:hypothetical protein
MATRTNVSTEPQFGHVWYIALSDRVFVRSGILMVVTMNITIFWYVTPCSLLDF